MSDNEPTFGPIDIQTQILAQQAFNKQGVAMYDEEKVEVNPSSGDLERKIIRTVKFSDDSTEVIEMQLVQMDEMTEGMQEVVGNEEDDDPTDESNYTEAGFPPDFVPTPDMRFFQALIFIAMGCNDKDEFLFLTKTCKNIVVMNEHPMESIYSVRLVRLHREDDIPPWNYAMFIDSRACSSFDKKFMNPDTGFWYMFGYNIALKG